MIITKLKGGLGNQMFQYALGRVLSLKQNTPLGLDIGFYESSINQKRTYDLEVFNVKARILENKEIPFLYRHTRNRIIEFLFKIVRFFLRHKGFERSFSFNNDILLSGPDIYLDGYWQSYKYFENFEDIIRQDFKLRSMPSLKALNLAEEIKNNNSLCVHVRRGDYVGNKNHDVVDLKYYKKAVEVILGKVLVDRIYIFSDDIKWCKKNLSFKKPVFFVEDEYSGERGEWHMFLMSVCKNFVISNSTFSWWGAWLCDNKGKKVVCPKKWFLDPSINTDDLIPPNWIRI